MASEWLKLVDAVFASVEAAGIKKIASVSGLFHF
jgi:hypothetical protein